jgi:hypothetical protein
MASLPAQIGCSSSRAALIDQHATRERDQAIAAAMGGLLWKARTGHSEPTASGHATGNQAPPGLMRPTPGPANTPPTCINTKRPEQDSNLRPTA